MKCFASSNMYTKGNFCLILSEAFIGANQMAPPVTAGKREAMANAEQFEILKQGVNVWNKWRAENLGFQVDLFGAELSGADLREANLSRADLRQADLWKADLWKADLSEADLSGANLMGA